MIPRMVNGRMQLSQGPEKKYLDTQLAAGCFTASAAAGSTGVGTFTLLNGLTQGAGGSERLGRQFTIKSIGLNVYIEPALTTVPGLCRLIIFYDTQCNGAAPATADVVLEAATVAGWATSHLAMAQRERFKIVYDKRYMLGSKAANQTGAAPIVHNEKFRKQNVVVTNNAGTTNAVTSIATNSLYALTLTTCLTADPVATIRVRIRYTDA